MARRVPQGPPPPPVVQRIRMRYAKRGRLRFSSHRDFARAFERALRRAEIPMAYSAGFSPHPKISYLGAAPTGVASEAEYLEIGLSAPMNPDEVRTRIDSVLPSGLDIVEAVESAGGPFAELLQASSWQVQLPGIEPEIARAAVAEFLSRDQVLVQRLTKQGRRELDARAAVESAVVITGTGTAKGVIDTPQGADDVDMPTADGLSEPGRAILAMVVRQEIPAVRPDDVLAALRSVAGLAFAVPPLAMRLAQGPLDDTGVIGDPLAVDRAAGFTA